MATYTSGTTANTYLLNTTAATFPDAQAACKARGGNLVAFGSVFEQLEVESYFISAGVLLPAFHNTYWMGYTIPYLNPSLWPRFASLEDGSKPSNSIEPSAVYSNWGIMTDSTGTAFPEPNNFHIPEFCVAANYSQLVEEAWGWADANCDSKLIFMCKVPASPPPSPPPPPPSPTPPPPPLDNTYTSPKSRNTYVIPGQQLTFYGAKEQCEILGGQLVVHGSFEEQQEVEAAFMAKGWFATPKSNGQFYWMGLAVAPYSTWPDFVWLSSQSLKDTRYSHWGVYNPGAHLEPNNIIREELCAGANRTQAYGGAFGWSDENCARLALFICELQASQPPPPSPAPPEELSYYFNPKKTSFTMNSTYMLYNQPMPYFKAMQFCIDRGGYLTVYNSLMEQREVERFFISIGLLGSAKYSEHYWLGYRVVNTWPNFLPVNPASSYSHWGTYQPGFKAEPNQMTGPELCACANSTESYSGAWGWADAACANHFPFICTLAKKWLPPAVPALPPHSPIQPPDAPSFPAGPEQPSPPPPPAPPSPPPPSPPPPPPPPPRQPPPSPEPPSPPPPSPRRPPPPQPPRPSPQPPAPPPPAPVRLHPFPPPLQGAKVAAAGRIKAPPMQPPPAKAKLKAGKPPPMQPPPAKAKVKAGKPPPPAKAKPPPPQARVRNAAVQQQSPPPQSIRYRARPAAKR